MAGKRKINPGECRCFATKAKGKGMIKKVKICWPRKAKKPKIMGPC